MYVKKYSTLFFDIAFRTIMECECTETIVTSNIVHIDSCTHHHLLFFEKRKKFMKCIISSVV